MNEMQADGVKLGEDVSRRKYKTRRTEVNVRAGRGG